MKPNQPLSDWSDWSDSSDSSDSSDNPPQKKQTPSMQTPLWPLLALVAAALPACSQTRYPLMVDTNGLVVAPTNFWRANSNRLAALGITGGASTNGFVGPEITNGLAGLAITNRLVDTNLLAQAALPWQSLSARLLAAVAAGAYQPTAIQRDSTGLATNATVLWPDGTGGVLTVTEVNPTWLAVDAYTITYTNLGKTITQPAVSRDHNGHITNAPALTITP